MITTGRLLVFVAIVAGVAAVGAVALLWSGGDTARTTALADPDIKTVEIRASGTLVERGTIGEALAHARETVGFAPLFPSTLPGPGYRLTSVDSTKPGAGASAPASVSTVFTSPTSVVSVLQGARDALKPAQCEAAADAIRGAEVCQRRQVLTNAEQRDVYWVGLSNEHALLILVAGEPTPEPAAIYKMVRSMLSD